MQKAHAKVQQQLDEARLREANLIAEAARSKARVLQLLEDQQQVLSMPSLTHAHCDSLLK